MSDNDLSFLKEEELVERYNLISKEYTEISNVISPLLLKLSKLDREISILREEILKREEE